MLAGNYTCQPLRRISLSRLRGVLGEVGGGISYACDVTIFCKLINSLRSNNKLADENRHISSLRTRTKLLPNHRLMIYHHPPSQAMFRVSTYECCRNFGRLRRRGYCRIRLVGIYPASHLLAPSAKGCSLGYMPTNHCAEYLWVAQPGRNLFTIIV